jgi:hypothetical protein
MAIVKTVGASIICFLLFTVGFIAVRMYLADMWKTKATGVTLLRYWTIQSPVYWLLAIATVGCVVWLFVRRT